jgi:RNA polymerase sigma-70 factor (ECF subfamily)
MVSIQSWRVIAGRGEETAAEADLLRAGRTGDQTALARLLAPYRQPLYALCRGMLGAVDDAEEAVQETFLRALRALPGFRGEASVRTWLFRIAVNVCLEWRRARRPVASWDEAGASLASQTPSPESTALCHLRVMEALRALPPRHRAILLLKELEGWSAAEIAAALRVSEHRIRNELSRARRTLADWRQRDATGEEQ